MEDPVSEGARRNKAERVGDLVESLLKRSDTRAGLRAARVCAAWKDVAGPVAAAHSKAVRVTDGELVVAVDSPAWASEMSLMRSHYLQALQERMGKEAVTSIRFTVSKHAVGRRGVEDVPQAAREPEREPITDAEADAIRADVASRVSDDALVEAIARARIATRGKPTKRRGHTGSEQR